MIIGVPKEIKNHEYRVGMVPASVHETILFSSKAAQEMALGSVTQIIWLPEPRSWPPLPKFSPRRR